MLIPDTERDALEQVMRQAETDLAAAHADICKLQGVDPAKTAWPVWSAPGHTLQWFEQIRAKFNLSR